MGNRCQLQTQVAGLPGFRLGYIVWSQSVCWLQSHCDLSTNMFCLLDVSIDLFLPLHTHIQHTCSFDVIALILRRQCIFDSLARNCTWPIMNSAAFRTAVVSWHAQGRGGYGCGYGYAIVVGLMGLGAYTAHDHQCQPPINKPLFKTFVCGIWGYPPEGDNMILVGTTPKQPERLRLNHLQMVQLGGNPLTELPAALGQLQAPVFFLILRLRTGAPVVGLSARATL